MYICIYVCISFICFLLYVFLSRFFLLLSPPSCNTINLQRHATSSRRNVASCSRERWHSTLSRISFYPPPRYGKHDFVPSTTIKYLFVLPASNFEFGYQKKKKKNTYEFCFAGNRMMTMHKVNTTYMYMSLFWFDQNIIMNGFTRITRFYVCLSLYLYLK